MTVDQTQAIDQAKLNELLGRFVNEFGATGFAATVVIGDRLGLYQALATGPATPAELAERTGTHPRLVAEWLAAQAASGYHPDNGWAIGCAVIARGPCEWLFRCRTSPSTCDAARPRSGGSGPPSRRSPAAWWNFYGMWAPAPPARRGGRPAHHLWLVLEDAKRETAQPADLQAVVEEGAAAFSALGADYPQTTSG
jgi:hypothetical protein